jgi:uncharacterized repeat protein (TIGR01451 family)
MTITLYIVKVGKKQPWILICIQVRRILMNTNFLSNRQLQRPALSYVLVALAVVFAITMTVAFTARTLAAVNTFRPPYIEASQPTLTVGQKLTYSIHLINNSEKEANANVADVVPIELSYVTGSASNGGVYDPVHAVVTWDNVKVPGLGEVVVTFDVKPAVAVTQNTEVVNVASIQIVDADGLGQFSHPFVAITLVPGTPQVLNAFKWASLRAVTPGQKLTFTIQIVNSAVEVASVNVTDPLPAELAFVEGSQSDNGIYDSNSRTISWRGIEVGKMSEKLLTFDVKPAMDSVTSPIEVVNIAVVTKGTIELKPQVKIVIVPGPLGNVPSRPEVSKVTIGDKDVLSDPNVILHTTATPDAKWMFIREFSIKEVNGTQVWMVDHTSGWIAFEANHAWKLDSTSGVHFVSVDVADENLVRSWPSHKSFDFASLNLPNTVMEKPGLVPYLVYYEAGVNVNIELTPVTGNADLYVWYPWNFGSPDQSSELTGVAVDKTSFTTPKAGIYVILVNAVEPTTYNLSIQPAGGPNVVFAGADSQSLNAAQASTNGAFTGEPLFSQIGLDPLGSAQAVTGPIFVRIPLVTK